MNCRGPRSRNNWCECNDFNDQRMGFSNPTHGIFEWYAFSSGASTTLAIISHRIRFLLKQSKLFYMTSQNDINIITCAKWHDFSDAETPVRVFSGGASTTFAISFQVLSPLQGGALIGRWHTVLPVLRSNVFS